MTPERPGIPGAPSGPPIPGKMICDKCGMGHKDTRETIYRLNRALDYANTLNEDLTKEIRRKQEWIDRLEKRLAAFQIARDA